MKRKKTYSPQHNTVQEMIIRVQEYQPAKGAFNYAERGYAVTEAHRLYNESFQLSKIYPRDSNLSEACRQAHRLWVTAFNNAFKPGFWDAFERLSRGDAAGIEVAVAFLEADPWFYRTGYVKTKLIRYIKSPMLTHTDKERLANVVLSVVDKRDDRDFRAYCRLACKVDSPELRDQLAHLLKAENRNIQRRARWVLEALGSHISKAAP